MHKVMMQLLDRGFFVSKYDGTLLVKPPSGMQWTIQPDSVNYIQRFLPEGYTAQMFPYDKGIVQVKKS